MKIFQFSFSEKKKEKKRKEFSENYFSACVWVSLELPFLFTKKNWLEKNTYLHLNLIDFKIQNFNIVCTLFNNTIMYLFI